MTQDKHDFCRALLAEVRVAAQRHGVIIPKKLRAIRSTVRLWWVQGNGPEAEYVKACCAYAAKGQFIANLLRKAEPKGER
jgi:hypothetical protein